MAVGTGGVSIVNSVSAGLISSLGFTTAGVVKGSIAAGIQAGIGSVAAGSPFALFQSLGALQLGVLGSACLPIAIAVGIVGASIPLLRKYKINQTLKNLPQIQDQSNMKEELKIDELVEPLIESQKSAQSDKIDSTK